MTFVYCDEYRRALQAVMMDGVAVASLTDGWAQDAAVEKAYRETDGWVPYKAEVQDGVLAGLLCVSPTGEYRIFQRRAFAGQDWTANVDTFLATKRWDKDLLNTQKL